MLAPTRRPRRSKRIADSNAKKKRPAADDVNLPITRPRRARRRRSTANGQHLVMSEAPLPAPDHNTRAASPLPPCPPEAECPAIVRSPSASGAVFTASKRTPQATAALQSHQQSPVTAASLSVQNVKPPPPPMPLSPPSPFADTNTKPAPSTKQPKPASPSNHNIVMCPKPLSPPSPFADANTKPSPSTKQPTPASPPNHHIVMCPKPVPLLAPVHHKFVNSLLYFEDSTSFLSTPLPKRLKVHGPTPFQRAFQHVWTLTCNLVKTLFPQPKSLPTTTMSITSWSVSEQPYWP